VAPSGGRTQSEVENLDPLLATHFPNSLTIERDAIPAAAHRAKRVGVAGGCEGCHLTEEWYGLLIHLPHTKVQEWRDIPGSVTRGTRGPYTFAGQDFSCLPGDWISSSHIAPG